MFERTWHKFAQCQLNAFRLRSRMQWQPSSPEKRGAEFLLSLSWHGWTARNILNPDAAESGAYCTTVSRTVLDLLLQCQGDSSGKVEGWKMLEARSFWHGSLVYDSMICRQLFLERTAGTSPDSSVQFCVGPDPDAVVPSNPVSWLQNCPFRTFIEVLEVNVRPCETCTARQGMYFTGTSSIILKILFSLKGATATQLKLVDAKATFDAGLWCRPGESHRFHVDATFFCFFSVPTGPWVYSMGDARFNAVTIN